MLKLFNSLFAIFFSICIFAQTDPNTDPNWDWINGDYPGAPYPSSQYRMYIVNSNGVITDVPITAPWGQGNAWIGLQDMKREDGWVLISRDFGTPNRAVWAQYQEGAPYFILYNKFRGILRVFIMVKSNQDLTSGALEIKFHQDNTFKTATLTHLKPRAYATDKLSIVQSNEGLALSQTMNDNWAWADYPMAYDPTFVATDNGAWLDFQVIGTIESAIKVAGTGTGINGDQKAVRDFMTGTNNGAVTLTTGAPAVNTAKNFNQFITSVFGTASTWDKWKQTISDFSKKMINTDNTTNLGQANTKLKGILANIENSWLLKGLPYIGSAVGLVDFLTGGGKKNDQSVQPSFTGMNLTLNGSITTTLKLPNPRRIQVPSSKLNPNVAVFGSYTPLVYNSNVGVLNLTSTPVVKYKTYYQSYGNNQSRQYIDCQLQDNLSIAINPASGLTIDSIMAYIVMDPSKNVNLQMPTSDPDLNLLAVWTTGTDPKLALESGLEGRFIFRSKMVPYDAFKYQRVQGPIGNYTPDITIKIKAVLHRTDDPTSQPVLIVLTYEPDLVADGTGNYPEPFYVKVSRVFEFGADQVQPSVFGLGANPISVSTPSTIGDYVFVGWSDGNKDLVRAFSDNANVKALYKYPHHSNNSCTFTNNSQRKLVRTDNGYLHCVYESMGYVWYEKSADGGITWEIMNNRAPLSFNESKQPSIDYRGWETVIVFQEKTSSGWDLVCKYFDGNGSIPIYSKNLLSESVYDFGSCPTICWASNGEFLIVYRRNYSQQLHMTYSLAYYYGFVNGHGFATMFTHNELYGTTSLINQFSSSAIKTTQSSIKYHLAWDETNQLINYYCITRTGVSPYTISYPTEPEYISNSSGFVRNYSPSLIPMEDGTARICWIGERGTEYPTYSEGGEKTVVFTDPSSVGRFWTFGSRVNSTSINKITDRYTIAWAKTDDDYLEYTDSRTLRDIGIINKKGKDVQLSNGTNQETMCALAFNTKTLPYYMQTAQVYSNKTPLITFEKREGIVSEADAQVYFSVGDATVDNEKINFFEIPDTAAINSQQSANQYLVSEPFSLTDNSDFYYSINYGINDSLSALSMLCGNKSLTFKVELIDAVTNEILGVFDEVTYDQGNLTPYEKADYQVLTNGIGERTVKLRLVINSNFSPEYSISEKYDTEIGLAKKQYKQISYQGSLAVTEYALSQNYPNPFNPVTTINYQIPKDGFVSLKVYDILGKEIATLVNSDKAQGRYTVEFDGSRFASGMYIYRLQSGDYVETRKMMLLK